MPPSKKDVRRYKKAVARLERNHLLRSPDDAGEPSRLVLLGNVSIDAGITPANLTAALRETPPPRINIRRTPTPPLPPTPPPVPPRVPIAVHLPLGSAFALLEYSTAGDAAAAHAALDGSWCSKLNRKLCAGVARSNATAAELIASTHGGSSGGGTNDGSGSGAGVAAAAANTSTILEAAVGCTDDAASSSNGGGGGRSGGGGSAPACAPRIPPTLVLQAADVDGLTVWPDIVTETEEAAILETLGGYGWDDLSRRRVQHYGHRFDYSTNSWAPAPPPTSATR